MKQKANIKEKELIQQDHFDRQFDSVLHTPSTNGMSDNFMDDELN